MIREMVPGDEARLDAFLAQHADTSMFLRSNLAAHGLGASDHPHATTYYAALEGTKLTAVLARTAGGMLMVQAPDGVGALPACLAGQRVAGITGAAEQAEEVISALGLCDAKFTLHHDEPLCTLPMDTRPSDTVALRRATVDDVPELESWFATYLVETGLAPNTEKAMEAAHRRAQQAPERPDLRLLERDGALLGMTDLNARAADAAQIGGVFVTPRARGRGLAGAMVQAQLAEAWDQGTRRAVLFANNAAAFRAYQRIGFAHIGAYRVAVLAQPQEVLS